ncbi:hypothetical protein N7470_000405 [Penicillium chermesinum]|nr:hypothetical protein N7470_000405 [Penicillium chermesinum]
MSYKDFEPEGSADDKASIVQTLIKGALADDASTSLSAMHIFNSMTVPLALLVISDMYGGGDGLD